MSLREGFVRVKDLPETRELGIAGLRGRARGLHAAADGVTTTQLSVPGFFKERAPCVWLENTCRCWPGSVDRCDQCRDIL